jgi:membrane protein YdbS with pleckstrin-like domain
MSGGQGPTDPDDSDRPDAGDGGRGDPEERPEQGSGPGRQRRGHGEGRAQGGGQGGGRGQNQERGDGPQRGGPEPADAPGREGGPPQANQGPRGEAEGERGQQSAPHDNQAQGSPPADGRERSDQQATGGTPTGVESAGGASGMTDDVSEWLSLEHDEETVWVGEPTKLRLVGTAVTGVILIPFLIGILVLLFLPVTYLSLKHTDYVVTNRSLYVKQGVLSTNVESIDLDRIQNTEFTQSFWGKQLGFGTIDVSTAGSSGADISFSGIEDAREVRDEITRVQRQFAGSSDRGARDGTGGGGRASTPADDAQVAELVSELRGTREALERVAAKLDEDDHEMDEGPDERTG